MKNIAIIILILILSVFVLILNRNERFYWFSEQDMRKYTENGDYLVRFRDVDAVSVGENLCVAGPYSLDLPGTVNMSESELKSRGDFPPEEIYGVVFSTFNDGSLKHVSKMRHYGASVVMEYPDQPFCVASQEAQILIKKVPDGFSLKVVNPAL